MTPIEIIACLGWCSSSVAACTLWRVSRALGESAKQNQRLIGELEAAEQHVKILQADKNHLLNLR